MLLVLLNAVLAQDARTPHHTPHEPEHFAGAAASTPILGGWGVSAGEWPDVAAIYGRNEQQCTGVLIAEDVVLTAAHCLGGLKHVKLGITDLTQDGERIPIAEAIAYPDWERTFDLAVLVLERPSAIAPRTIAQACVVDDLANGKSVTAVGFGAVNRIGTRYIDALQQVQMPITDHECTDLRVGCMEAVSPAGELIAGGEGEDTCFGDSGGPLYFQTNGEAYLAGITSREFDTVLIPCGSGGIYVRPDAAIDWIEEVSGRDLPAPDCADFEPSPVPETFSTALCGTTGTPAAVLVAMLSVLLIFLRRAPTQR